MDEYLKVAIDAALQAGKIFKQYFGHPKTVAFKNGNRRDFVTEIDRRIETQIRAKLGKKFPTHKIIGEEYGTDALSEHDLIWIIDPIDGTTNFIQGLPICCISIALWDEQGPLVAVVYNPILNYLFNAKRGKGAFLNNKRIHIPKYKEIKDCFGGYGWGRDVKKAAKNFPQLVKKLNKVRTLGSSTMELAFVAAGIYDFHIQAKINAWDFAASILLIKEAGGMVTDWHGKTVDINTTNLIASNHKIHKQLLSAVKKLS